MVRTLSVLLVGAAIGAAGLMLAEAQESQKHEIKGGIEGTVRRVDTDKEILTIRTADGKERSYTITDDTTIVGPRGGKVRHRLKDPRFHEGMELTVVATGTTAKEVHLGFQHRQADEKEGAQPTREATKPASEKGQPIPTRRPVSAGESPAKPAAGQKEEEEEEDEFPGKIKRVDPTRRMLVISLLNGKDRSFLLSSEAKVLVKGTASKEGLRDAALKTGIPVTVVTEPGGRKVREVQVNPVPTRSRKAG
jgi:hypothetical protein